MLVEKAPYRKQRPHKGEGRRFPHILSAALDTPTAQAVEKIAELRGVSRSHAIADIVRAAVAERADLGRVEIDRPQTARSAA